MRIISLIIIIITSLSVHGQVNEFEFGFCLYPSFSKGIKMDHSTSPNSTHTVNEVWKPAISGNVFVEYIINKKLSLSIGFGYKNYGEKTEKVQFSQVVTPDPETPDYYRFVYNHHNLEIPLSIKYFVFNNLYVSMGTSLIYNMTNSSAYLVYYNDGRKNERIKFQDNSVEFRKLNGSLNLGIGLEMASGRRSTMIFQPYTQYGLKGIAVNVPSNRRMFTAGLLLGYRF